ncbi:MAG: hypothetical protein R6V14_04545 [Halanaerobiales bacterium]
MSNEKENKNFVPYIILILTILMAGIISSSPSLNPTYEDEALIGIDWVHFKLHEGEHYYLRDYFTLGGRETVNIVIYTGENEAHLLPIITANDGAINVSLYENSIITSNGTEIIYYNSNYNYGDLDGLTIYDGAVVSNFGDYKGRSYIGSGRTYGGVIRAENEIILQPNTTYVFQITNQITNNNVIDIILDWYED